MKGKTKRTNVLVCFLVVVLGGAAIFSLIFSNPNADNAACVGAVQPIAFDTSLVNGSIVSRRNVEQWAVFEYDTNLPARVRNNILRARTEFVFGASAPSWVAHGVTAAIIREDGTEEAIPDFKELFPYWDLEQLSQFARAQETGFSAVLNSLWIIWMRF